MAVGQLPLFAFQDRQQQEKTLLESEIELLEDANQAYLDDVTAALDILRHAVGDVEDLGTRAAISEAILLLARNV